MSTALLLCLAALVLALRIYTLYQLLARPSGNPHVPVLLRWGATTLAILCLFVATLRPTAQQTLAEPPKPPPAAAPSDNPRLNIFLLVDRSPNSWVDDFGSDHRYRMVGIRADLTAIVRQFPRANFSIIAFSSAAKVDWPLSADVWSLEAFIENYSAYQAGTGDLDRADPTAASAVLGKDLAMARQQYPESHNIVFYLGEGRRGSAASPAAAFALGPDLVSGGAVLGYGSPAGGQVPERWDEEGQIHYVQGPDGPLVAAPDETALRQIAGQLSVPYSHRGPGEPISAVLPALPDDAHAAPARTGESLAEPVEYYWVFAMIAAMLLAAEAFLLIRELRRDQVKGAA